MNDYNLLLKRFPEVTPDLTPIADDPPFDPNVHLALGLPDAIHTLRDFGYSGDVLESVPTQVAATACFQVLSEEGVAALYHVCKQLEAYTTSNPRISRNVRGGVYRSGFLRDLALSVDVGEHLSSLMQTPLLPHAMGHQLAHLNYQPKTVGENVDKWHYDTLQVDYVMFVTDPNQVQGGEFQYFQGTREEMAEYRDKGAPIPAERVIAPTMPGAGYAVLMQGNYVVHQAKALSEVGERITLVNGYSYADDSTADYTAVKQLHHVDPRPYVNAEYARQMALRCGQVLSPLINTPAFNMSDNKASTLQALTKARAELDEAIHVLSDETAQKIQHFGD